MYRHNNVSARVILRRSSLARPRCCLLTAACGMSATPSLTLPLKGRAIAGQFYNPCSRLRSIWPAARFGHLPAESNKYPLPIPPPQGGREPIAARAEPYAIALPSRGEGTGRACGTPPPSAVPLPPRGGSFRVCGIQWASSTRRVFSGRRFHNGQRFYEDGTASAAPPSVASQASPQALASSSTRRM